MSWLRELRIARGFRTQEELSKASGVARTTIAKIESGIIGMSKVAGLGIARALGMSFEVLDGLSTRAVQRPRDRDRNSFDDVVARAVRIDARVVAAHAGLLAAQRELSAARQAAEERIRAALAKATASEPEQDGAR